MNTHDIELPPLPTPPSLIQRKDWYGAIQAYARSYGMECARAAIEADRQRRQSEAEEVCAEAYQVVGSLLSDLGIFETDHAKKILDNLSQARMVHKDVLPWPSFDRQRRGEPVLVGWTVSTTGGGILHASKYTEYEAKRSGYSLPVYRLTSPRTAEPDSAKCAECGAELIPVRPGKWQHPDCSQSYWAADPVKVPSDDLAHEIWAAAQTAPGEGIEDAVERVAALLARFGKGTP